MACLAFTPNLLFGTATGDIPRHFLNWDIKLDKLGNPTSPTDSRNLHFVFQ